MAAGASIRSRCDLEASGGVVVGKRTRSVEAIVGGTERARDVKAGVLLVVIVASVLLATASYTLAQNNDTRAAAMGAWSLGTRGTTVLPADWPEDGVSWPVTQDDGTLRVNRFPGVLYWGAPFYAVPHLLQGRPEPPPHPYLVDFRPAATAAVAATTGAVLVSFLIFLRLAPRRIAFGAALFVALGTSTWSISGNALWTHGLTHLFLGLGVLLLASDRPWAAGFSFGFSIFTRPQTAMVALVMGASRAVGRRSVGDLMRVGIPSALGLIAVVAYSWVNFGKLLPTAGYGGYAVDRLGDPSSWQLLRAIWGTLFDPWRGLVIHAPFLLVLLPGLRRAWAVAPPWVRSAALAGVAYQLFQLQLNEYSGGFFFFSYRLPLEMLILAAPLLLLSFTETVIGSRVKEVAFVVTASIAIGLQLLGVTLLSVDVRVLPVLEPMVVEVCGSPDIDCTPEEVLP